MIITVAATDTRANTSVEWFVPTQETVDHNTPLSDTLTLTGTSDQLSRTATMTFDSIEKYTTYLSDQTHQQFLVDRETHNAQHGISSVVTMNVE
jgi:hypothetical protein